MGPVINTQTETFGGKSKMQVILLSISLTEVTHIYTEAGKCSDVAVVMSDHVLSTEPRDGGTGWGRLVDHKNLSRY